MSLRSTDWKAISVWATGVVVALVCLGWILHLEWDRQLVLAADRVVLRWVETTQQDSAILREVLVDRRLSAPSAARLATWRRQGDVDAFALYLPSGERVLASGDLTRSPAALTVDGAQGIGAEAGGERQGLTARILAGQTTTSLYRGGTLDEPEVYSQAFVPLRQGQELLGFVELRVNHTQRVMYTRQAVMRVGAAVLLLLLALGGLASWRILRRVRQQRQAISRVQYLADHDLLSGALNRSSFNSLLLEACSRSAAGGPPFALLCIDLDHFKEVNDSLGHSAGDEVLRVATQRLKACVRETDHLARLGGDEFAIVLAGLASAPAVTPLAQRIVAALAVPYDVAEQRVRCGGSVGVAIYGIDATEPGELLGRADMALYRAKANGRGGFSFFDIAMERQAMARRELARDLRVALAQGQFSLHFQPLFGRDARSLTGYEALLRWHHPVRGDVPPAEFVSLAEEIGVINEIGGWVLREACRQAVTWPASLTVAVNLSAMQFVGDQLEQRVARALSESGLPANRLELEITESLLMSSVDHVLEVLRSLSRMGVTIAMDDFGTGYSSLAYLWRFPFDKVKIDRAFTHNLGHDEKVALIVHSIISLAHSLDIRVNAEGVETPSQMASLQEGGCDELQGYLLGRPQPSEALTHEGISGQLDSAERRTHPRRAFFSTIPMPLPTSRAGPIV